MQVCNMNLFTNIFFISTVNCLRPDQSNAKKTIGTSFLQLQNPEPQLDLQKFTWEFDAHDHNKNHAEYQIFLHPSDSSDFLKMRYSKWFSVASEINTKVSSGWSGARHVDIAFSAVRDSKLDRIKAAYEALNDERKFFLGHWRRARRTDEAVMRRRCVLLSEWYAAWTQVAGTQNCRAYQRRWHIFTTAFNRANQSQRGRHA